ncbi:PaaI family thioesterase [Kribbella sp. NPDC055110]
MSPHLAVDGGPERLFGFRPHQADGRRTGSMTTGPWLAGPGEIPRAGALGVLVDNVLGTTICAAHPSGRWSVSTEIGIDLVGPVPADGTVVRARVEALEVDAIGAFATGHVVDSAGTVIAHCRQRGRFVPSPVTTSGWTEVPLTDGDLMSRLGVSTSADALDVTTTPVLANPMGNLHGGVSFCISEWAGALALDRVGSPLTAASVQVAYLRPVPVGTRLRFTSHVVHAGRTLGVVHVTGSDEAGRSCTVTTLVTH